MQIIGIRLLSSFTDVVDPTPHSDRDPGQTKDPDFDPDLSMSLIDLHCEILVKFSSSHTPSVVVPDSDLSQYDRSKLQNITVRIITFTSVVKHVVTPLFSLIWIRI